MTHEFWRYNALYQQVPYTTVGALLEQGIRVYVPRGSFELHEITRRPSAQDIYAVETLNIPSFDLIPSTWEYYTLKTEFSTSEALLYILNYPTDTLYGTSPDGIYTLRNVEDKLGCWTSSGLVGNIPIPLKKDIIWRVSPKETPKRIENTTVYEPTDATNVEGEILNAIETLRKSWPGPIGIDWTVSPTQEDTTFTTKEALNYLFDQRVSKTLYGIWNGTSYKLFNMMGSIRCALSHNDDYLDYIPMEATWRFLSPTAKPKAMRGSYLAHEADLVPLHKALRTFQKSQYSVRWTVSPVV